MFSKGPHCYLDTATLFPGSLSWPGLILAPLQRHYSPGCTAGNLEGGGQRRSWCRRLLCPPFGPLPKEGGWKLPYWSGKNCESLVSNTPLAIIENKSSVPGMVALWWVSVERWPHCSLFGSFLPAPSLQWAAGLHSDVPLPVAWKNPPPAPHGNDRRKYANSNALI